MSDTTAYERIKVLKILEDVPEVSESLKSGELHLSNVALAQSFFRKHEKTTGEVLSVEEKSELFENLKNKTTLEAKEFLARCNPEIALPPDEIRPLTSTHSQMKSTVAKTLLEKINYLKSLISHELINPTHEELLTLAFEALIEKTEKKKGIYEKCKETKKSKFQVSPEDLTSASLLKFPTQSLTDGTTRYISRSVKRFVLQRAKHQCEHMHSNGQRCTSKFQLQFDHITAFSKGGTSCKDNIQLLCRAHNAFKSNR